MGGIFARRSIAGIVGAEGGGGVGMREWRAENGGREALEGEESGRRKFGLTRVAVKVDDGCARG